MERQQALRMQTYQVLTPPLSLWPSTLSKIHFCCRSKLGGNEWQDSHLWQCQSYRLYFFMSFERDFSWLIHDRSKLEVHACRQGQLSKHQPNRCPFQHHANDVLLLMSDQVPIYTVWVQARPTSKVLTWQVSVQPVLSYVILLTALQPGATIEYAQFPNGFSPKV